MLYGPFKPINIERIIMKVRSEITKSHDRVWKEMTRPGARLSGEERVLVVQELRAASACRICSESKNSLSFAYRVGEHEYVDSRMPDVWVELVHKLVNDPGRIHRSWVQNLFKDGLEEVEYVEIAGLVSAVCVVDTFHEALSLPLRSLPKGVSGAASYKVPVTAADEGAYVSMIPVDGLQDDYEDLYDTRYWVPNVHRAFSLVPAAARMANELMESHYFPYESVPRYDDQNHEYAISKVQMELVASRVSKNNDCFY